MRATVEAGRLSIGGFPAGELAARFGTPLYVYDGDRISVHVNEFRNALPPRTRILYSCKANPSVAILRLIRELGVGLDACSPGDLAFAAAAGFDDEAISYVSTSMTDFEIESVARRQIDFTADSVAQVERYAALAPRSAIGLRMNVGIAAGFHPHLEAGAAASKFGIRVAELPAARAAAARHDVRVRRLHSHLGSELLDPSAHLESLSRLLKIAESMRDIEDVNLGGGWGTPIRPHAEPYDLRTFTARASQSMTEFARRTGRHLDLIVEPGAHFTLDAGYLLTTVTEVRGPVISDDTPLPGRVGVDTSTNHLVSVLLYDVQHPAVAVDHVCDEPTGEYDIVGNLLQAADVLARRVRLHSPRPGDVLAFADCGAYAAWRAPAFNERPRPAEVIVRHGSARLVRRAETTEDLLALEVVNDDDEH